MRNVPLVHGCLIDSGSRTTLRGMASTPGGTHTPVVLLARAHARAGREQEMLDALTSLVTATRQEQGCLTYEPHRGEDDPRLFVMYEVWGSEAHLEAHRQSPHLRHFFKLADSLTDDGISVEQLRPLGIPR